MRRYMKYVFLAALVTFVIAGVASATVTPINLGASTQDVTFTAAAAPNTTLSVQLGSCVGSTCTLSGSAFDTSEGTVGSYTFTTDTSGGNIQVLYPEITNTSAYAMSMNGATVAFNYTNGSNVLNGTVIWTTVNDSNPNPTLNGNLTITGVSGSSAFTSLFAGLTVVPIDFTLSSMPGPGPNTLTELFAAGAGASNGNTVSAGQINTPEPGTIALFGSGLLTLGGFLRRRKNIG